MRYLVSNIQWAAASLPPNAEVRLPRVMIVDCDCADEVFRRAEERPEAQGATILSAESAPMGKTPSMDDLDQVRLATRERIGLGIIMYSPPCELVKRVRETPADDLSYLERAKLAVADAVNEDEDTLKLLLVPRIRFTGAEPEEMVQIREGAQRILDALIEWRRASQRMHDSIMRVREEPTHSYVSRDWRDRNENDTVFTYSRVADDGFEKMLVYSADHEPWSAVEIHLPEDYFDGMQPHFIAIPNLVIEPVRPNRVSEEPRQPYSVEPREPTADDAVFTFVHMDDEHYTYSASHEVWNTVEIRLPRGYFGEGIEAPYYIAIPNFVVEPVRPTTITAQGVADAIAAEGRRMGKSDRVSEGRPVYRASRRARTLHIEDDGGLTFCGEIIAYLGHENVTDDVMGVLVHEPKGTCGRCVHYALMEVGGNAGRTAA